jgi:SAM-dependent methyltransferase
MTEHLAQKYEVPTWFNQAEVVENLQFDPKLSRFIPFSVAGSLGVAEKLGKLPDQISTIYEFGSGLGEGLIALDMFARAQGDATVQGSESNRRAYHLAQRLAAIMLPSVTRIDHDGLESLNAQSAAYDVVVAHMLGEHNNDKALPVRFLPVAWQALKPGGSIIIASDPLTVGHAVNWAKDNLPTSALTDVPADQIPSGFENRQQLIISK